MKSKRCSFEQNTFMPMKIPIANATVFNDNMNEKPNEKNK